MISPLLDIFFQYGGSVVAGLAVGLLSKAFFAKQMQSKIRNYQGEIVKSHAKILQLEGNSEKLEKKIRELEGRFAKDRLVMN